MRRRRQRRRRSVDRGKRRPATELRNHKSGTPTPLAEGEGHTVRDANASRGPVPRSRGTRACVDAPCTRTGRSRHAPSGSHRHSERSAPPYATRQQPTGRVFQHRRSTCLSGNTARALLRGRRGRARLLSDDKPRAPDRLAAGCRRPGRRGRPLASRGWAREGIPAGEGARKDSRTSGSKGFAHQRFKDSRTCDSAALPPKS